MRREHLPDLIRRFSHQRSGGSLRARESAPVSTGAGMSCANIVVFAGVIEFMFGKRAERDNLPLLPRIFSTTFATSCFPRPAFQAGINIGMFDNAEVFAGGNKNNLRHRFPCASLT